MEFSWTPANFLYESQQKLELRISVHFPGAKQNHGIHLLSHKGQNKTLQTGYGKKKTQLLTCQCLGWSIAAKRRN